MADVSRRDFMKLAGLGLGGLALNAVARFDKLTTQTAVLDTIVNYGSNISVEQRKNKIQQALKESIKEPEVFGSLIKFLALEVHANFKGYYVARDTIRNFLFGEGRGLNITDTLSQSLRKEPQWLEGDFDQQLSSDREVLQSLTLETLANSVSLKTSDPSNTDISIDTGENNQSFQARLIGSRGNTDTFFALRNFRISIDGEMIDSGVCGDCILTDRYDWDGRISDAASLTYGQAADIASEYLSFRYQLFKRSNIKIIRTK